MILLMLENSREDGKFDANMISYIFGHINGKFSSTNVVYYYGQDSTNKFQAYYSKLVNLGFKPTTVSGMQLSK
jgi:hypothetical protein